MMWRVPPSDYCVVLLLGARLTQRLNSSGGYARLSAATRAQIDLSRRVADMLQGKPFDALGAVVDQCLGREKSWVAASRGILAGVSYDSHVTLSEAAVAERQAFDLAEMGRPRDALASLETVINTTSDSAQRGWLKQQAAAYLHPADAVRAQSLQASA
jgi:hypothetical protein